MLSVVRQLFASELHDEHCTALVTYQKPQAVGGISAPWASWTMAAGTASAVFLSRGFATMTDRKRDGLSGSSRSIAISVYITLSKQGSVSSELAMLDDEEGMQVAEDSEQGRQRPRQ